MRNIPCDKEMEQLNNPLTLNDFNKDGGAFVLHCIRMAVMNGIRHPRADTQFRRQYPAKNDEFQRFAGE